MATFIVKRCGCGRVYGTPEAWQALPDQKVYDDSDGSLCEQRRCACGSHIGIHLVPAVTSDEFRAAFRDIDTMSSAFRRDFTAPELLRLWKVWQLGPDDLDPPDCWSASQCGDALAYGKVPS